MSSCEAAAEERKQEGANCTTLRNPSPPYLTGREACNHVRLSDDSWTLMMELKREHNTESYSLREGARKQELYKANASVLVWKKNAVGAEWHHDLRNDAAFPH